MRQKRKSELLPLARKTTAALLERARANPSLRKRGPGGRGAVWHAEVHLIGGAEMARLNGRYRSKRGMTDILSFPAPAPFRDQGFLGDLVICLPVLRRQAREERHAPEKELEVLLVHGVLHLLGLDHETGARDAAVMRGWEARLLAAGRPRGRSKSLIERAT
ncbi:MAG: rRNA maturation RNase YbeY [Oligoflexia bacterium]|nr:rRNA maturation RNase YbeY [Oligoflexia bacterium]